MSVPRIAIRRGDGTLKDQVAVERIPESGKRMDFLSNKENEEKENEKLEMDELLEILGNETRRKILELLTHEPLYVSQLSKILGVYPKAIERHLEKLKEAGLVEECFPENIDPEDRMARRRIYYRVKKNLMISVGIGPNQFRLTIIEPKLSSQANSSLHDKLEIEFSDEDSQIEDKLQRLSNLELQSSHLYQLRRNVLQLRQLDARIKKIEQHLSDLLAIRQQITREIEEILNEEFDHLDFYARQILRELLENPMGTSIQELSQLYNVGLQTIQKALEQLEREKLIIRHKGRTPRTMTDLIRLLLFDADI